MVNLNWDEKFSSFLFQRLYDKIGQKVQKIISKKILDTNLIFTIHVQKVNFSLFVHCVHFGRKKKVLTVLANLIVPTPNEEMKPSWPVWNFFRRVVGAKLGEKTFFCMVSGTRSFHFEGAIK